MGRARLARVFGIGLLLAPLLCSCGDDESLPTVRSIYLVPANLEELAGPRFFDHPWPSDLRLEAGSPRVLGFPNPLGLPLIDQYISSISGVLDGFSPAAAGYV